MGLVKVDFGNWFLIFWLEGVLSWSKTSLFSEQGNFIKTLANVKQMLKQKGHKSKQTNTGPLCITTI